MTTSADEPTRPTVPSSDAPTQVSGGGGANPITRATVPARPGNSDTAATVPAMSTGTAPTIVAGSGMSATAATALDLGDGPRPQRAATNSHEGAVWGDFQIGRLLGRGGMGAVYAGRQMSLDRPVAIKVLIGHLSDNEDFRKRFLLEARAAARINSPHVVQVYYAGTHELVDFFAMEFVEGTDLARRLKDGWRPTPIECLQLMIQATRSLVALGEHKIVHRDIKPANFMFTTSGVVKLMDFGLVKMASEAHGLTQTGTVMGTVNYFSPEQGRGEVCDQRTDIYALGVMFYELLTGKLPFTGGDATSVIYQHIHADPKPPKVHNPNVSEPYQSVVLKCLAKDAGDRYQTAKDLLDDLERMQRGEMPLLPGGTRRQGAASVVDTRKLTLAAAVVIAAVILGLAIILRPSDTPAAVASAPAPTTSPPPMATSATVVAPAVAIPPTTVAPTTVAPTSPATPAPTVVPAAPAVTPVVTAVAVTPAPTIAPPPSKPIELAPVTQATAPPPAPPIAAAPVVTTPAPAPPVATPSVAPAQTPVEPVVAVAPPPKPVEAPAKPVEAPAKPVEAVVTPPIEAPAKPVAPPPVVAVAPPVTPPKPPAAPIVKPTAPVPISTPVQSSVRVAIPAGDALLKGNTWLWWLEGPAGRCGRLSARSTRVPEITWTAPAQPIDVVLHVATIGSERRLTLPLKAVPAVGNATATLTPFLRANFADERHVQRLRRDLDGSWWLVDIDGAFISRNTDGWLTGGRFQPTPPCPRPLAVATTRDHFAVLDGDQPSLLLYARDGSSQRSITGFQRPVDLAPLADGTWAVADMRSGGVLAMDAKGTRVRTYQRSPTGGFSNLTRIVSDGRQLLALDAGDETVAVFDADTTQPVALWKLNRGTRPVAIASIGGRAAVLSSTGEVLLLDRAGAVAQKLPSAVALLPDENLGTPSDLTIDVTGEIYVTYPEREMIARHSQDGKQLSLRHARTWTWRAYAADGANRIYAIDVDRRRIVVLDQDGWRIDTVGKAVRQGGTLDTPIALAVHPDGQVVVVLDEETRQVTRFDRTSNSHLVFGGPGKNDGQFDTPVALAIDQAGRTYVLDIGFHRVSIFDANGHFLRQVGRYERGDAPDLLRAPRLLTVSPDGGMLLVYDEDAGNVKTFAIDHTANQARHIGNLGSRGSGAGQLTRVTGMGCDRRGRFYCLDYKRADVQVFDLTQQTPSVIASLRGEAAGIRRMQYFALNPDGIAYIIGGDQLTGLQWGP